MCCPCCKSRHIVRNGYVWRDFKTVPIGHIPVVLHTKIQRVRCKDCGCDQQEDIHFAHGKRTYTARLENLVMDLLDIATIKSVAEYLHLTWEQRSRNNRHSAYTIGHDRYYLSVENESKADEMLLKRCAYHGLNFAAPFIVMRHWDQMKKDGEFWCGSFETDEVDWQLAELIVNIQYACQRHYFGAMAEAYFDNKLRDASVNLRRQQKTIECFNRLPDEFTVEDIMHCFSLVRESSARTKIARLMADKLVSKVGDKKPQNGIVRTLYRKTGNLIL